jgi:hypothetical protein
MSLDRGEAMLVFLMFLESGVVRMLGKSIYCRGRSGEKGTLASAHLSELVFKTMLNFLMKRCQRHIRFQRFDASVN